MTNTGVIAVTEEMETAGAIVYCRVSGAIHLAELHNAWVQAGLDESLLPAGRTEESALKRAMQELPKGMRKLIRPLDGFTGFALVNEEASGEDLEYDVMLRARVVYTPPAPGTDDPTVCECKVDPADHEFADGIRAGFERHLNALTNNKISAWVWGRLAPACDAVSLRDTGGIYFIPNTHLDEWRKMVETVNTVSDVSFFGIPAMKSEDAVAAILDAISQEAKGVIERIEEELGFTGEERLGERALATRETKLYAVRAKVRSYEALLGQALPDLQAKLDDLDADVTAATLIASGDGDFV